MLVLVLLVVEFNVLDVVLKVSGHAYYCHYGSKKYHKIVTLISIIKSGFLGYRGTKMVFDKKGFCTKKFKRFLRLHPNKRRNRCVMERSLLEASKPFMTIDLQRFLLQILRDEWNRRFGRSLIRRR